ncbi:MAG: hypothetical protein WAM66_00965 [Acidobacteriaceae bacterium]
MSVRGSQRRVTFLMEDRGAISQWLFPGVPSRAAKQAITGAAL